MDNGQIPPVQPVSVAQPVPVMVQQIQPAATPKRDVGGLIKTIVIVILSLISITFIGLFIWMTIQYNDANIYLERETSRIVAEAKDEQHQKDAEEYAKQIKNPYQIFAGPADYGQLSFLYPKTWSVYIASDASNGGDYNAYFNPDKVEAVSKDTINALRVTILNKSYEDIVNQYQKDVEKKNSNLTVQSITIGNVSEGTEVTANKYTGNIPGTDLNGYIVIFKIRDKTVIMQTDSVLFEEDFNALLDTITFNA